MRKRNTIRESGFAGAGFCLVRRERTVLELLADYKHELVMFWLRNDSLVCKTKVRDHGVMLYQEKHLEVASLGLGNYLE